MNLMCGIDFTASNGNPKDPNSHHFRHPGGNQYDAAIQAIGSILLAYDSDGLVPTYGFGARINDTTVSHKFALNGVTARPEVVGIPGIMEVYHQALVWATLFGSTNFAPIISKAAKQASEIDQVIQDHTAHLILLIITDGEISDMANTTDAIVAASSLPLSIIIVGVGNADFSKMDILDGDGHVVLIDSNGRPAARDIVQFVPFLKYDRYPAALAAEVLADVPTQ